MTRTMFNFACAISLTLCAATLVLWVRSYSAADEVKWGSSGVVAWAWAPKGHLELGLFRGSWSGNIHEFTVGVAPIDRPFNTFIFMEIEPTDSQLTWEWGGFAWYSIRSRTSGSLHAEAVAPLWSIAVLTGALPFRWVILRLRSRARCIRQERGFCPTCGYDLRASAGRCPECGKPVARRIET